MPALARNRLALGLAALLAFFVAMLLAGGPASPLDRDLLYLAQRGFLVPPARWLTRLGDGAVVLAAGAVAAGWLLWRGAPRRALLLILILFSCRLLVEVMKLFFDRARPDPAGHEVAVHSMAFPSGHAANAIAAWLAIALLAAPPRHRVPAVFCALAVALVVGLCRLVLGVHWPSDVAGGWALGAAWTLLLVRLAGERLPADGIDSTKERIMTDRTRPDDSEIIDATDDAPAFGGSSGGNLQRDIGSRDEVAEQVEAGEGVTRVRDSDKPEQADLPRFNQGNSKLNP